MGKRPPNLSQRIRRLDNGVGAIFTAVMLTTMVMAFVGIILVDSYTWLGIALVAPLVTIMAAFIVTLFIAMWVWAYREWRKHGS
jgi:membrane protein YdbS with pleckstrin-like domain